MTQDTEARINKILDILEPILSPREKAHTLGFMKTTTTTRIPVYIGNNDGHPWYFFEEEKKKLIEEEYLVGYIMSIVVMTKDSDKFGEKTKLKVGFKADRNYVLTTGLETFFSKGLISALQTGKLTSETRVKIHAKVGDSEKVVLISVFNDETGDMIIGDKINEGADLVHEAEKAAKSGGFAFRNLIKGQVVEDPKARSTSIY